MGAYGGPTEIMKLVAPLGPMYQAGTLSGNPLAMAAGIATLRYLRDQKSSLPALENAARSWPRCDCRGERCWRAALPQPRRIHVYLVLHRRSGDRLEVRRQVRHQGLRPILPRHAGSTASIFRRRSSKLRSSAQPTPKTTFSVPSPPPNRHSRTARQCELTEIRELEN